MKSTIEFSFKLRHSTVAGTAKIIDRNSTYSFGTLRDEAEEVFGNDLPVTINKIGVAEQRESDGYMHVYDIYESYQDSGSEDYYYFAINTGCYPL